MSTSAVRTVLGLGESRVDDSFPGVWKRVAPGVTRTLLDAAGALPIFTLCQTVLGESDARERERGGEVGENLGTGTGRLTMGHPALRPDLGRHVREETGGSQGRLELAPEERGEGVDGHQPSGLTGRMPR